MSTPARLASRRALDSAYRSPTVLWGAFALAHLWLGFLNIGARVASYGDVLNQYRGWAQQADLTHVYVGITTGWVYPIVALVPMLLAAIFGFAFYGQAWFALVFLLDGLAFAALVGWNRPHRPVGIGWWWIVFLLLLGPIAIGRIDSISVPIAIIAVLQLATRPRIAAVLLTIATWIKVWPIAILISAVIAVRSRLRVLIAAAVSSALIIAGALLLGAGTNVLSFVTKQTTRALQLESPAGTVWMWLSFFHVGGSAPYLDEAINTFEVAGPGSRQAAALLNPILAIVVVIISGLGAVAIRRGAPVQELLAPLTLALVTALIVFNKVGSPQYMTWLAVPIILGLAIRATGHGRSFRIPAGVALAAAALTQSFFPYLYVYLIAENPALLVALTIRNILTLVLFAWATGVVVQLARGRAMTESVAGQDAAWLPGR